MLRLNGIIKIQFIIKPFNFEYVNLVININIDACTIHVLFKKYPK
jgi:hypothetical protein